jgi:hypothetical protein
MASADNKTDIETLDALAKMRERFKAAEEAEAPNRTSALEALRFYWGEQWEDSIERQRKQDGRPCFTLNKLPAILRQVLNESEANPPAIQINPVSDGADEDIAEAIQGLCKHVENNGEGASVAYFRAFLYMVIGGFGSWRVLHDYLPKSFDQDAFLDRIPNPMAVYWDPASVKLDKSDAGFCFVTKDYSAADFKAEFPGSELCGMSDFAGIGDQAPGWVYKDGCRVVEYFTIETENVDLVKLEDGTTCYEDEIPEGARIAVDESGSPISRPDKRRKAFVAVSNGVEWLKPKKQLPTDDIPIVTITADDLIIDGETRIKGAVADLMEPARLFNYNSSAIGETMALGSKANWLATAEQIEPYQEIWRQANTRNFAVLPYKSVGNAPPPEKISTEPPIQAMSAARLQSADDLRSISGVYDATQAPNGGEESGKAILARRRQTSTGNSQYLAALARGIKRTAQILIKYFPVIYDAPRVMRIVGADQQPKQIMVHAGQGANVPPVMPDGIKGVFDLSVGNYDVTVSVQLSEETKRQEAVELLLTLCQANPAIVPLISDLVVNEMDFSGKKAVVSRLQKALPPNLQDDNPGDPAQLQSHNSLLMGQNKQLMAQVQHLTQMMQTKAIESQSREKVEGMKLEAAHIRAEASLEQERVKAQASILSHAADQHLMVVHDHALADKQNTHQAGMAKLDQIHSLMSASHQAALAPPPAAPNESR